MQKVAVQPANASKQKLLSLRQSLATDIKAYSAGVD
jgi:hypothetical protein